MSPAASLTADVATVTSVTTVTVTTRRGITAEVRVYGDRDVSDEPPIVFVHGFSGLFDDEPMLAALADTGSGRTVYAPVLPGYGPESTDSGEQQLDDMLDVTLHGWDLVDALGLGRGSGVHLVGHDMGAMIAAEMAAVAPSDVSRLSLLSPLGLWNPASPLADIFSLLPFEFPALLFADVDLGTRLLTGGLDFEDPKAIEAFQVRNSRRLGFAGKLLFPIPNRRLSKRAYRIAAPTTVIWGEGDSLTPPQPYASMWESAITGCRTVTISEAGHCVHLEQPSRCADAVLS